jgi:hypothetical protein
LYLSIVDKAVMHKKALNEGAPAPSCRPCELLADDLLAVDVKEGRHLDEDDVSTLVAACDIPPDALSLGSPSVLAKSP